MKITDDSITLPGVDMAAAGSPRDDVAWLLRVFCGAWAGLRATGAMSALLVAADAIGLMPAQPPYLIVRKLFPRMSPPAMRKAALVAHFGYGAVAGAAYGILVRPGTSNLARGAGFGLLLWAGGYEGWLPLLRILPPAHRDHRGRAVTMIIAHLVYGATLARSHRKRAQTHGKNAA